MIRPKIRKKNTPTHQRFIPTDQTLIRQSTKINMKGRESKGPPSADLLVCFPSRARLTLMPKPICSPARASEPNKRHHNQFLKKSAFRSGIGTASSPLLWAKTRQISSGEISAEPTSPKVTCAGQIKVRQKASAACKNWQSVMEEIERIHHKSKHRKKSGWIKGFGLKKDLMQFLACLRNIRFDFRCFGVFPQNDIVSDDDEDEEEEDEEYQQKNKKKNNLSERDRENEGSRTVFSKWFSVLHDQNNSTLCKNEIKEKQSDEGIEAPPVPPPNALLLMRCRSAPAKSWLEEKPEEEEDDEEEEENRKEKERRRKNLKALIEEEKRNSKTEQNLVVMRYDTDFYKISTDIAKETWIVGGIRDPFSRSRSWKR